MSNDSVLMDMLDQITAMIKMPDEDFKEIAENLEATKENLREQMLDDEMIELVKKDLVKTGQPFNMVLDDYRLAVVEFGMLFESAEASEEQKDFLRFILDVNTEMVEKLELAFDDGDVVIPIELVHPNAKVPTYAHTFDAGCDVYATEDFTIPTNARGFKINSGLKVAIPPKWKINVVPRSGLTYKTTMRIANSPGTIDYGYLDEVGVLIDNLGEEVISIKKGQCFAQLIIDRAYKGKFDIVPSVKNLSQNREGGFGSTDSEKVDDNIKL